MKDENDSNSIANPDIHRPVRFRALPDYQHPQPERILRVEFKCSLISLWKVNKIMRSCFSGI